MPVTPKLPIILEALQTWPIISETVKLRLNPCCAVEQNVQAKAQPTWEDTQRVARSASGIYTVSTCCSPTCIAHFIVPSAERCSTATSGALISATALSFSRNFLLMFVILSKLSSPK